MSFGVVPYCTEEGGSGFIPNSVGPWQSTFNITQLTPVYDQDMGWMRMGGPGSFTYYPEFEVPPVLRPSSVGGRASSPTTGIAVVQKSCGSGMGHLAPGEFETHFGHPEPDETTCQKIQCGAIRQENVSDQLMFDCANDGYAGVRSCHDPVCKPFWDEMTFCHPPETLLLTRELLIAPMPSITQTARAACQPIDPCGGGNGPGEISAGSCLVAALVAAGVAALLFGGGK